MIEVNFNRTDIIAKTFGPFYLTDVEFEFLWCLTENGLLNDNIEYSYYDEREEKRNDSRV